MHETEALHIRRLTAEDLEPLHRLLSDPAVSGAALHPGADGGVPAKGGHGP